MGWGSSSTPPWVNAKRIDEEKKKRKAALDVAKIAALEKENDALKKRIKKMEDELEKLKK